MASSESRNWEAIAQEYSNTNITVTEICLRHEVSRDHLYKYLRSHAVPPRSSTSRRGRNGGRALSKRLLAALDRKVADFERRLGTAGTAVDEARDARTLNTLVGLHDKLKALNGPASRPRKQGDSDDASALRLGLARRLEALVGRAG